MNMHLLVGTRHGSLIQYPGNYVKVNNMLEIDIFRNSLQKNVGVLKVIYEGLGA